MAAKAKAAARRAAAAKKIPASNVNATSSKTTSFAIHDPSRPPPLNPKDQIVFKQILHQYESKNYSAALKNCEALLSKYPGHGETTAMAGLLHHSMNNKAHGYLLVKAGMKADLKSHIVWHVYGIMTRADRNYVEAVKSYNQALRLDPENHNILRDLAVLQIQVRQYEAYVESRWKLLRANRRSRNAWMSLVMAYVLNKQKGAALEVLNTMENFEVVHEPQRSFERSELVLFKSSLLPPSQALEANYLSQLGRVEAAEWAWLDLLDINDESRVYLLGYLKIRTSDQAEAVLNDLIKLAERYPGSGLIKRTILDYTTGADFDRELKAYLSSRLTKGIPSVYNDLKPLLSDNEKSLSIKTIAEEIYAELEENGKLSLSTTSNLEPPSTLVWALHFLSQLYSSRRFNMTEKALEVTQKAISHTPSLPDLYISLSRIYKRQGSFQKAAEAMRAARDLDGQDRYLNSKCAKYVLQSIGSETPNEELRIKLLQESRGLIELFTRNDAPDPVSDLLDMQAVWYLMAEANVALRISDWGIALKRLHQVVEIFRQWEEDQYDFHTYCIRKSTFQAYTDLIKYENSLYNQPIYYLAISKAISIYLILHDRNASKDPKITEYNILVLPISHSDKKETSNSEETLNKTENEPNKSKKALKKAKMAEIKAKAHAAFEAKKAMSKIKNDQTNSTSTEVVPPIVDDDPTGERLLKTERPLEVANELLKAIENNIPAETEAKNGQFREIYKGVHLLRFEIEFRKENPLLALKALLKAHSLSLPAEAVDSKVFNAAAKLKLKYLQNGDRGSSAPIEVISNLLRKELESITQLEPPAGATSRLAKAESLVAEQKLSGAEKSNQAQVEENIFKLLEECENSEWKIAIKGFKLLKTLKSDRLNEFRERATGIWNMVDDFKPKTEHNLINGKSHCATQNDASVDVDFFE
ncbi:NMDA receptor-regulated protein 1-domain-containing protein [Phakopsora pachyrhizi]|uniref:NMDA receptor-regulated protein 1-domain-containing protein n=1 Tax=Phakopsora pachyrhizi TaxID=170000 RepID=A0AAV0AFF4_PHAPC|nr:NMDA receptor-regulated protein 1-domain-containing protein [Phakopsora pachyrhizi]